MKPVIVVLLLAAGVHLAPVVVPVLSPDRFIAYMKYLPMKLPVMEHSHERAVLPQWYADQFGWEEIVAETAQAWNRLSPAERGDCGIFAQDYGQAGAIDFLGRRYGLPPALSGHQTYFLWGPRGYSGNCMIVLDDSKETLEQLWDNVEYVGTSADNPYALEKTDRRLHLQGCEIRHAGAALAEVEALALRLPNCPDNGGTASSQSRVRPELLIRKDRNRIPA